MNIFKRYFNRDKMRIEAKDILALVLGLLTFIGVSLITITNSSIWFDEAFGAYLIRFDFFEIAKYTAADVHPPFYYWLLKVWSMLFGNSELALRSMSVLFGALAIVLGYLLVKKLFGQKPAGISMVLMAITPMLVRYSQEARMYTLVTAIAIGATLVLLYAVETNKRKLWITYGVLVGLGMLTHYFSVLVWLTHWLWRAVVVKSQKPKKFMKAYLSKNWLTAFVAAIVVFLPWLPFFASQLFTVQAFGFWIPPVTPDTLVSFFTNSFFYQDVTNVVGWQTVFFVALVAIIIYLAAVVYRDSRDKKRESYLLIMFMAFMPTAILVLLSMPPLRSSFIDRYLITSSLMMSVFVAVTLFLYGQTTRKHIMKRNILIGLFVISMLVGVFGVWQQGNYNKNSHSSNNTRQIVEIVKSKSTANQPIIAATPWLFYEVVYYNSESNPVYYIAPSDYPYGSLAMLKDNAQFKINDLSDFLKTSPTFWYIGYSSEGKLDSPIDGLELIQEIEYRDTVNGKPAYIAKQFKYND